MANPLLVSGDTSLGIDPASGMATLSLVRDGVSTPVMEGRDFLTVRVGESIVPARITRVVATDIIEFQGEFPGLPDWQVHGRILAAGDLAERFDWRIRIVNLGDEFVECSFHIKFGVADTGVPRWMVPAMFYKHNRPANCVRRYPRYSPDELSVEEFVSPYWAFRSDRSSCPSVFCWTDNFTSCLATGERFGDEISGVGFRGDETGTYLMLNFPYVEEPAKYSFVGEDGTAPERCTTVMPARGQVDIAFSACAGERDLHAYDGLIRDIYDESEDEPNPWLTKDEASGLLAYGLHRWHYDREKHVLYETCAFDRYFAKNERHVDRPHMHVAWVSGIPYAYILWREGVDTENADYAQAGISVIDKVAGEGLSPSGFFYAEWTEESGWGTGWNPSKEWVQARTVSEATWFLVRALEYAKEQSIAKPEWESAAKSNLDRALRAQRADGNFGSYYNVDSGAVEEWDGAGGLMWIPALLAAAKHFGTSEYLEAAKRAGDYYARFVEDEYIYGAPEDVHLTPTSEDGYNAVIAYTHLYEVTKDDRWLSLAASAADWTATFRWTYNTKFPEETILAEYDFRTLGGDIASPSNNHLHNYGLICLPEFLRLWQYTGDTYYLSRAADHLACFHQFIARRDGDFNARKGMITEQWFHTDWTHAKGSMLQLAHSWCAGLILYANAYVREFGDLLIDAESREVYLLDSTWIKETEDADPDVILTLANPSVMDVTLTIRQSRLGIIGTVDVPALDEIRIKVGGVRPKLDVLAPEGEMWNL